MTDDLVKRLRRGPLRDDYETAVTMGEAADYIEKLEDALRELLSLGEWGLNDLARAIAREALGEHVEETAKT